MLKISFDAVCAGFVVVVCVDQGSDPNPARPPVVFVVPEAQGFANDDEVGAAVGWLEGTVGPTVDEVVGVKVLNN